MGRERPLILSAERVKMLQRGATQIRVPVKNPDYYGCLTGDCPHEKNQADCDEWMAREAPFQVGDRLRIKEAWREGRPSYNGPDFDSKLTYRADETEWPDCKWRSSVHMPRWACRIFLEIIGVRVERVQDITPLQCLESGICLPEAKGVDPNKSVPPDGFEKWSEKRRDEWFESTARAVYFCQCGDAQDHFDAYATYWDAHYADKGNPWSGNPWAWVYEIKTVERP